VLWWRRAGIARSTDDYCWISAQGRRATMETISLNLTRDDVGRIYNAMISMPYGDFRDNISEELKSEYSATIQCGEEIKIERIGYCDMGCCLYYTICINGVYLKEIDLGEQSDIILTNCTDDSRDDNVSKIISELLQCNNMAIQIDNKSTPQEGDDGKSDNESH
jgi:hypothetical protein